jgi:hypothetical protein
MTTLTLRKSSCQKLQPLRVFGANHLPAVNSNAPIAVLAFQESITQKVKAKVKGLVDLSGSIQIIASTLIQISVTFEIFRDGKSVTNGPQFLFSGPRETTLPIAFSVVDSLSEHNAKSHVYTLVITNQSTTFQVTPVMGVPLGIGYLSMTVVGASSSKKGHGHGHGGLQLFTNQIYTPSGVSALTFPPSGQRNLNLSTRTTGGNAKIDINFARIIPIIAPGLFYTALLFADIKRDGKSIFNGEQLLLRNVRTGGTPTAVVDEFLFSLTLFDFNVPPGDHWYQVVMRNASVLNGAPTELVLDTIAFQILIPNRKIKNCVTVTQNIPPALVPALTLPSQTSVRLNLSVPKNTQQVKVNGFVNFILPANPFTVIYDLLRDGESIREFAGPQFVVTENNIQPAPLEYNFRTSFTDQALNAHHHTYTLELTNLSTDAVVIDYFSYRILILS